MLVLKNVKTTLYSEHIPWKLGVLSVAIGWASDMLYLGIAQQFRFSVSVYVCVWVVVIATKRLDWF